MTGVLAGGAGAVALSDPAAAQAKAFAAPGLVPAKKLQPGDVIVGPGASVVRVASVDRLPSGRRRVRYTDPYTGAATAMSSETDQTGFSPRFKFVVLARGAGVPSVQLTRPVQQPPTDPPSEPPADGPNVIDGGAP
jgi:hypothetical protein